MNNLILKKQLLTDFDVEFPTLDISNINEILTNLSTKMILGEIHSSQFSCDLIKNNFVVNLTNVSHEIKNLIFESNKIYGDVDILNSTTGKIISEYNKL